MTSSTPFDEAVFRDHFPVHRGCRDGDVQGVGEMLLFQPLLTGTEDPFQIWTPIHWAASFGHLDCVRQVASVDPNVINIQSSRTFQTPLHAAVAGCHPHCALWLLQAGTNPEVKDNMGETALHKAARAGSAECVSLLVAVSSNVGSQNMSGQTASVVADLSGYPAIAAFIRQRELSVLGGDFQPRACSLPMSRSGRKRRRDAICDDDFSKRLRTEGEDYAVMEDVSRMMDSSVSEHTKLCSSDMGYRNTLLECMLSEYHGC